ncbi:hypothetical protein SLE2022_331240 [Rubroshorea leprosula]
MAVAKSIIFLAFPLFFCTSSVLFLRCNAVTETMINDICKQTEDPGFCVNILRSDPRTDGARDMHGLALISISLTSILVQETLDKIPDILKGINDTVGEQRMSVCNSDYVGALAKFRDAFSSTDKRSYGDSINSIRDGTNLVIDCQNIYRRNDPIAESPLAAENMKVFKLSGIMLTIISSLG